MRRGRGLGELPPEQTYGRVERDDRGVPYRVPAFDGLLPGMELARVQALGTNQQRAWCERWLGLWLEAGGTRCRVGPAEHWPVWWEALHRRGFSRSCALSDRIELEQRLGAGLPRNKQRGLAMAANRLHELLQEWADGVPGYATPIPPGRDWLGWWKTELGLDLRMLCCLYETAMIQQPGRRMFRVLRHELRVVEAVDQKFH
jgi:hypothetical protein